MRAKEVASLLAMGALWGGSFAFQRVLVPLFGPLPNTFLRLIFASFSLLAYCLLTRHRLEFKGRIWTFVVLGIVSSALPYTLFAVGAKELSTAILAVLNATAPLFGAVFSAIWLREKVSTTQLMGLFVGAIGVAIVSQVWNGHMGQGALIGVLACLVASACYGLAGVFVVLWAKDVPSLTLATAGQLFGGIALAPLAAATWPRDALPSWSWPMIAVFGVLCSATPYVLYMWLIGKVGATRSLTVTYLIPVFGCVWGLVLLHEPLTLVQVLGGLVILVGTYLVSRKDPAKSKG